MERRKLTKFPDITVSKLFDGTVSNQFEKYTMDQFIKRDDFRKLKTLIELNIFRKNDVNNLYEYNGTIIKKEYPLNKKSIINVTNKINEINDKYLDESNNVFYLALSFAINIFNASIATLIGSSILNVKELDKPAFSLS